MVDVGVVGAGVAAAGLCCALERADVAAEVTVLEATGEVGGRAATLRREDCAVDVGANYLTDDDGRVNELVQEALGDDLVDVVEPVYTFDADGEVSPGRDGDGRKWTVAAGLVELPRRLLDGTSATVHCGTRVETVRRDDAAWTLVDAEGGEWGPFDAVAITPPAPETAALLRAAAWETELRAELADVASAVPYRPIHSAVLGYEFAIERPYYALVNTDREHELGWISREECKRGHVPAGKTVLVAQASPDWTRAHAVEGGTDDAVGAGEAAAALAEHAADVLGDERLREPAWTDGRRFPAALPDERIDPEPVAVAREHGLHLAGDWVAGEGRLHAAIRSGLDAGEAIVASL